MPQCTQDCALVSTIQLSCAAQYKEYNSRVRHGLDCDFIKGLSPFLTSVCPYTELGMKTVLQDTALYTSAYSHSVHVLQYCKIGNA